MKNHFFARKFYFIVKHCYIDAIWRLSKKSIYIEFPPSPSLHGRENRLEINSPPCKGGAERGSDFVGKRLFRPSHLYYFLRRFHHNARLRKVNIPGKRPMKRILIHSPHPSLMLILLSDEPLRLVSTGNSPNERRRKDSVITLKLAEEIPFR